MRTAFQMAFTVALLAAPAITIAEEAGSDLYQRRILPILQSPNASSCTECHFTGVDLKNHIGDSERETFATLRSLGLIDLEHPDESKLLRFISRSTDKTRSPGVDQPCRRRTAHRQVGRTTRAADEVSQQTVVACRCRNRCSMKGKCS